MSKRKPLNDTAGYVASRKTPFGYLMILDRQNGGDWVDAEERWVISALTPEFSNIAFTTAKSLKDARATMKDAINGHVFWLQNADY